MATIRNTLRRYDGLRAALEAGIFTPSFPSLPRRTGKDGVLTEYAVPGRGSLADPGKENTAVFPKRELFFLSGERVPILDQAAAKQDLATRSRFWRGEAGWKAAAAARTQREGQAAESFIRPRKSRKTGTEEERLIPQTAASAYPQTMLFSGMESGGKMDLGILAGCGNPFRRIEDAMQKNAASSFLEQRERFLISQYAPLAEKKDAAGAKKILPPLSLPMADGLGDRPGRLEPSFRKAGKKAAQNLTRTAIGWEGLDAGGTALWKPAPSQLFSQATGENERKGAYTPFDLNKCLKGEKERFALRDRAEAVFPMMRMNFKKPDLRLPARWENGEFFRNSDKKSSFFRPDLLGKRISGTFPKEAFEPDFIPLPAGETKTLRERAEAPSGQSFVSLAPTVTVTTGDIRNDVDVNDLVAKIERALAVEIAASGAETLGVNE